MQLIGLILLGLEGATIGASFKQHDIDARKAQIKLDLQTVRPEALTIDLVQRALWGGGLSNSIFCEEARIDSMSAAHMEAFTSLNLRSDGCTVGSYGLPFEDLMKFAEMIEPSRAAPLRPQCYPPSFVRGGFEYHDLGPGSDTCIAVAVPGCGNLDLCELMKHSVIAAAAGTGSSARGQHHEDHVAHAPLSKCAPDVHTQVKAFNLSYAETGVFELELSMNDDDCVSVTEGLALQAACDVRLDNAACSIAMLDTISDQEILSVAKCLSCSCNKMAVAVVGDVEAVPHDRELLYC